VKTGQEGGAGPAAAGCVEESHDERRRG
jgi:hypothetical protein